MRDPHEPVHDVNDRRCLILELPELSDEAALQLCEFLQQLTEHFDSSYDRQILRAHRARESCARSRPSSHFPSTTHRSDLIPPHHRAGSAGASLHLYQTPLKKRENPHLKLRDRAQPNVIYADPIKSLSPNHKNPAYDTPNSWYLQRRALSLATRTIPCRGTARH
ncbi:MAG: hypothetical protein ACP5P4_15605 [Steroidobacteraceae bacterium]